MPRGVADGTEMAVGARLAADAARCSTAPANKGTVGAPLSSEGIGLRVGHRGGGHPVHGRVQGANGGNCSGWRVGQLIYGDRCVPIRSRMANVLDIERTPPEI